MPVTLDEAARLAGGHRWAESRLFEILGSWVASTDDIEVKLLFDRHSQHHAWRADQWWDRLPVLAGVDREALVVAPSPAAAAAADTLGSADGVVDRLAGAYRVALPRLLGRYERHRTLVTPAADGAVIRTLDLLVPDVATDWRQGEVLLQDRIGSPGDVERAAATVARLERLLLGGCRKNPR
jgi:hypothetical protein